MPPVSGRPHLSIVVPSYNEEQRLERTLSRILEWVRERRIHAEIVVVDDGSTDETARLAKARLRGEPGRVLGYRDNRGKGYAVRQGVLAAGGRWVLITDADLSTPIEEHDKLAEAARERDLDVVIGSRALPDSQIEVRQSRLRESMGKSFNRIIRMTTGLRFHDTQCGFKLLDRQRTQPLVERMVVDGFAYDVELLYLCVRLGLRVAEVPVVWRNDRASKVGLVADPLRMLYDVGRIRWRFRRGHYYPAQAQEDRGTEPAER